MSSFDAAKFGPAIANLLAGERLCELGPGNPNRSAYNALQALNIEDIVPNVKSQEMAACCLSGLWLWHDFLDESHDVSQDLRSSEGSFWHGIMHRREPDYSNAKYWFRLVGTHPIYEPLAESAAELADSLELDASILSSSGAWEPYAFIDLCKEVARGRKDYEDFCRRIARIEWQLLFNYCYDEAQA